MKIDMSKSLEIFGEEAQMAAVEQDRCAIRYIDNPSEAVQLAAVQRNGYAIRCIHNPYEAVQLAAVRRYGGAIQYIDNPSEAVQLAAVDAVPAFQRFRQSARHLFGFSCVEISRPRAAHPRPRSDPTA